MRRRLAPTGPGKFILAENSAILVMTSFRRSCLFNFNKDEFEVQLLDILYDKLFEAKGESGLLSYNVHFLFVPKANFLTVLFYDCVAGERFVAYLPTDIVHRASSIEHRARKDVAATRFRLQIKLLSCAAFYSLIPGTNFLNIQIYTVLRIYTQ
jgi:hypothetical protein